MMENFPCRRWITTNQDEYRNPINVRVDRKIESDEFARYEECMEMAKCKERDTRAYAKSKLCCMEQNQNREPVYYPTDSHINPNVWTKPCWCRCLATGDPNCFEETREEKCTDDMCYCKQVYRQMEPTPENNRQKRFASNYFVDFRDPDYSYIRNKMEIKKELDEKFWAYKNKVDAEDAKKEPKITPAVEEPPDRVDPNCMELYESLPPEKLRRNWKPDETWWREETSDCVKGLVKKYIWTSTYREMNKDGAALPLTVRPIPDTCIESPPGDPVKPKVEMAPVPVYPLGEVFEQWDRPQIRTSAGRCDTIYNRPDLDYDTFFKCQRLCRTRFARCPEMHEIPSEENMRLARENKLRMPYDRMIPGYAGYDIQEAPPVCKIKKSFDPADPYEYISCYQAEYTLHPKEVYESPVAPYRPFNYSNVRVPLPDVSRLSCYLECNKHECPVPKPSCD